jgi:hypothetical protein
MISRLLDSSVAITNFILHLCCTLFIVCGIFITYDVSAHDYFRWNCCHTDRYVFNWLAYEFNIQRFPRLIQTVSNNRKNETETVSVCVMKTNNLKKEVKTTPKAFCTLNMTINFLFTTYVTHIDAC